MAKEIGTISDVRWPNGVRLPVALTFEHQSGEGVPLLPGDRPNAMVGGAVQYGARTGIWNILEVLDKLNVKATFFVCGTTAEKYPDAVKAAAQGRSRDRRHELPVRPHPHRASGSRAGHGEKDREGACRTSAA